MRSPKPSLRSGQILELLASKHALDIFFSEVKDGPTIFGGHLRLDALAIRKSWSPIRTMGYEIKVSRADWLSDHKWQAYIPLVHDFTIVAPAGVVLVEELPPHVGLYEVASTGASLRTIRKPVWREIVLPGELLLYLLMNRVSVTRAPPALTREERVDAWKQWLSERRDIAGRVRGRIHDRLNELRSAAGRADELAKLDRWLDEQGAHRWGDLVERVENALARRETRIHDAERGLRRAIADALTALQSLPVSAPSAGSRPEPSGNPAPSETAGAESSTAT